MFFTTILSLERLALIDKPMKYRLFLTKGKAKIAAISTWLMSVCVRVALLWLNVKHAEIYKYGSIFMSGVLIFIIIIDAITFYKLKEMKGANYANRAWAKYSFSHGEAVFPKSFAAFGKFRVCLPVVSLGNIDPLQSILFGNRMFLCKCSPHWEALLRCFVAVAITRDK